MGTIGNGKTGSPLADRYDGKPFLKLIDSFVLKCIGELNDDQESLLVKMTPKFQQTFSCTGTWEEIVIDQLKFPQDIRESIQNLWNDNKAIAQKNGLALTPMHFVEMFVDNNVT